MEVAGLAVSAVALATLFTTCLDCWDLIKLGRGKDRDYQILQAGLDAQRVRFVLWGHSHGLHQSQCDFKNPKIRQTASNTMRIIIQLFQESDELSSRYGLTKESSTKPDFKSKSTNGEDNSLRKVFRRTQLKMRERRQAPDCPADKWFWVISDRKRFEELVNHLRSLITDLESITETASAGAIRKQMVGNQMEAMSEEDLFIVKEQGHDAHDELSDAASACLERRKTLRALPHPESRQRRPWEAKSSVDDQEALASSMRITEEPDTAHDLPGHHHVKASEPDNEEDDDELFAAPVSESIASMAAWSIDAFHVIRDRNRETNARLDGFQRSAPAIRCICEALKSQALTTEPARATRVTLAPVGHMDSVMCQFLGTFCGPRHTIYEGGLFFVIFNISSANNIHRQRIQFFTKVYHPNISENGDVLPCYLWESIDSLTQLEEALLYVRRLLQFPAPEKKAVATIVNEYINNRQTFDDKAAQHTKTFASRKPPVTLGSEFGLTTSDEEYEPRPGAWFQRMGSFFSNAS